MPDLPSLPAAGHREMSSEELSGAHKVLDSLRFRVCRLIDQELAATLPGKGRTARESSSVQPQLELFDDDTGEMIFG